MSLPHSYIPTKPFPDFKWKWACLQCTEGLNDPVVLLGVLFRMRKLELKNSRLKYSSSEFAEELRSLSEDVKGRLTHKIDLSGRVGERNLIRNSGQYWSALGLIPAKKDKGLIQLTEFGRNVADRKISQTEFAALTIQTFCLPNPAIQKQSECEEWQKHGIKIKPLLLLLQIMLSLETGEQYITKNELLDIIIPLSGTNSVTIDDYVQFLKLYRSGSLNLSKWPMCHTSANDHRIAVEFFLFLENYGYVQEDKSPSGERKFVLNNLILEEIQTIVNNEKIGHIDKWINGLKENSSVVQEIERKRVQSCKYRPNQARFRKSVLGAAPRCIITNVTMPEVLEAAHIVPFKYHGEDTIANGLCMRMDIHQLFDSGHLRIHANGEVFLTDRARMEYGRTIPPEVVVPKYINRDFLQWRWDNYNGL